MKHLIVVGDGMADEPCRELCGLTPVEAAWTPAFDELSRRGRCGMLSTVPEGFDPGSEVAHLSLLGYDLQAVFEGRGVLEAAGMGIDIRAGDMMMRCNLISIDNDGSIKDHTAGHISSREASVLIDFLNEELADDEVRFYQGKGYRHVIKIKGGDKRIYCSPPHDVRGHYVTDEMVYAKVDAAVSTADYVNRLIKRSRYILAKHPVNLSRVADGKYPANGIWPWSPGYKPVMPTLSDVFGIRRGYVVSAVDLINGLGIYSGLEPIYVEGATGAYDTNYEGKVNAVTEALRGDADFVFLHLEGSDEAGHEGDAMLKKRIIEDIDSRVIAPLLRFIEAFDEDVAVAFLPDHPTPCSLRVHTSSPVPFVIWYRGIMPDSVQSYSERVCAAGGCGLLRGDEFIKMFLKCQNEG